MQASVNHDREKYIGGSDIPIIMNLSPFKSRFDLLLEKAGYKSDDFGGSIYTEYGNKLEPAIRAYISKELGTDFAEGKHIREAQGGEIIGVRCHTDGEAIIGSEKQLAILEIKTTSKIHDDISGYKLYIVQLLFYMVNCDADVGYLAVYERPDDMSLVFDDKRLRLYKVYRDEYQGLIDEIADALEKFVEDLQKVKDDPFISEADLLPVEIPDITAEIIALESQLAYMKETELKIKSEKERLKLAMEAASVKSFTTPNGYKVTYTAGTDDKLEEVTSLDQERLKEDHPRIYKKYLMVETKVKKGRAGYIRITAPKKSDDEA